MSYLIFNYIVKKASQTCSACGGTGTKQTQQPQSTDTPKQPFIPRSASEVWATTPKGTRIPKGFLLWTGDGYEGWYYRDLGNGQTMMLSLNNIINRRGGMIIETPGASPVRPINTRPNTASRPVSQQPTSPRQTSYRRYNNANKRRQRTRTPSYNSDPRYAGLNRNAIRAMNRGLFAQDS